MSVRRTRNARSGRVQRVVRQTQAARNAETTPLGNSFATYAGDLLARAQRGELKDVHAQMLAEAERETWRKPLR